MLSFLIDEDRISSPHLDNIEDEDIFSYDVALGNILPQPIVISDSLGHIIKFCTEMGFDVILYSNYLLEFKQQNDKVESVSTSDVPPIIKTDNFKPDEDDIICDKVEDNKTEELNDGAKKPGLLKRLFGRKENTKEEVDLINYNVTHNLKVDLRNPSQFKQFLIDNGYLTAEQCRHIENIMVREKSIGRDKRIIQVARSEGILDEDLAAECLTRATSREVLSKNSINKPKVIKLNRSIIGDRYNFFYMDIDHHNKVVKVGKDLSSELQEYLIETQFVGYSIIQYNFVEGVTEEIIHEIFNTPGLGISNC